MFKQLLLPFAAVAAFIVVVGLLVKNSGNIKVPGIIQQASQKTVTVGGKSVNVEIAKTKDERERGLSGRISLNPDSGMLFVFDSPNITPSFWMKGMLISLDIIWINDGKIVAIDKNVPPPQEGTPDSKLVVYNAGKPVDYVLEVAGGFSDKNNIKTGDSVDLSNI